MPHPINVPYVQKLVSNPKEVQQYVRTSLRADLARVALSTRAHICLQLWSALNPDPKAPPPRPIVDVRRYVDTLLCLADEGRLRAPPRVAAARRDAARSKRRESASARNAEQRRIDEVATMLARGEYPGFG